MEAEHQSRRNRKGKIDDKKEQVFWPLGSAIKNRDPHVWQIGGLPSNPTQSKRHKR